MWKVHEGDCREVLKTIPDDSIDSCVTDPPFEIAFMGSKWDANGVAYQVDLWKEVSRVLKPGAHLLAFGATRTSHRMVCAIEDAGFEIRETIFHLFGQGFPKSMDVSKAIDREAGAEREVVGRKVDLSTGRPMSVKQAAAGHAGQSSDAWDRPWRNDSERLEANCSITAPATPEAAEWEGWGTALKPAASPIVCARKGFTGTVASNVLKHGTGALNIDGCRVGLDCSAKQRLGEKQRTNKPCRKGGSLHHDPEANAKRETLKVPIETYKEGGRWPPNVCLSPEAAAELDRQSGEQVSGIAIQRHGGGQKIGGQGIYGGSPGLTRPDAGYGDSGGASRFFPIFKYEPKASRSEREAGLYSKVKKPVFPKGTHPRRVAEVKMLNPHPTVKSIALMQWLVTLVTPKGGTILDPFVGSGTTGIAAVRLGFDFIGIEQDPKYVKLAVSRIEGDAPLFNKGG